MEWTIPDLSRIPLSWLVDNGNITGGMEHPWSEKNPPLLTGWYENIAGGMEHPWSEQNTQSWLVDNENITGGMEHPWSEQNPPLLTSW